MSDREANETRHEGTSLPNRAEIHFTDDPEPKLFDEVTILPSGWVKVYTDATYSVEYYPPQRIKGLYTHD
jgi:hypothetical protein